MTWAFEHLRSVVRRDRSQGRELAVEVAECLDAFDGDPAALVMASRRLLAQRPAEAALWWVCARVLCATDPDAEIETTIRALVDDPTARRVAEALPFPCENPVASIGWSDVLPELHRTRPDLDLVVVRTGAERAVATRVRESGLTARVVDEVDAAALGVGHTLVEPTVLAPDLAIGPVGTEAHAARIGAPIWLIAPVGTVLPEPLARALVRTVEARGDALTNVVTDQWDDAGGDTVIHVAEIAWTRAEAAIGPHGIGPVGTVARNPWCPVAPELLRVS